MPYHIPNRKYNLIEGLSVFLRHLGINADYHSLIPTLNLVSSDLEFADNIFREYQINPQNTICLCPRGSDWGANKIYLYFDEIIEYIANKYNYNVLVLGAEKDFLYATDSLKNCRAKYINLCGQTTILQAAAIISKSKLVLGVDTGLLHIACAVNTPNIALMTCYHFGIFFPYSKYTSAIYLPTVCMNCDNKCKYNEAICLQRIRPSTVKYVIDYTLNNELNRTRAFIEPASVNVAPAEYKSIDNSIFSEYVEVINM